MNHKTTETEPHIGQVSMPPLLFHVTEFLFSIILNQRSVEKDSKIIKGEKIENHRRKAQFLISNYT